MELIKEWNDKTVQHYANKVEELLNAEIESTEYNENLNQYEKGDKIYTLNNFKEKLKNLKP